MRTKLIFQTIAALVIVLSALQAYRNTWPQQAVSESVVQPEDPRLHEQCWIWGLWRGSPAALPSRPCFLVNVSFPQLSLPFPVSDDESTSERAKDIRRDDELRHALDPKERLELGLAEFQPLRTFGRRKILAALEGDSFVLGGTGPVPSLAEYIPLLQRLGRPIHMVQIGAHAGGNESNEWVHAVLDENPSWTATVVEPLSGLFQRLTSNYSPLRHRVEALNLAVSTRTGPCEMMAVKDTATSRSDEIGQTSTLALDAAEGTRCFTPGRPCGYVRNQIDSSQLERRTVQCVTIPELVRRRRLQVPVDVLIIDTEMLDYTLLRNLNFREIGSPLAVQFESKTMTMQQGAEIMALLTLSGYLCRFEPMHAMRRWYRAVEDPKKKPEPRERKRRQYAYESVCYRML